MDLIEENFDLALRVGALADDTVLAARTVATFYSALFASPLYLRQHGAPAAPQGLENHAILCLPSDKSGSTMELYHRENRQRYDFNGKSRVQANSPELLLRLAMAGLGIACIPVWYVNLALAGARLERVLPVWQLQPVDMYAVFPGRRLMPVKTRVFLDMLQVFITEHTDAAGLDISVQNRPL